MSKESQPGSFSLGSVDSIFELDFLNDSDEEALMDLVMPTCSTIQAPREAQIMNDSLAKPALDLPPPEIPTSSTSADSNGPEQSKRFKSASKDDILHYFDSNHSEQTKKQTAWGMKTFQAWCLETGMDVNMTTITPTELATVLTRFYCEVRAVQSENRLGSMPQVQAEEYHKSSMKALRNAINRYIQDIGRNVDIVRDSDFKVANRVFNGMLKDRMKTGASRPVSHKSIISDDDLHLINGYFQNAADAPIILRQYIWYAISIHFVTRGMEMHHQLRTDSFSFQKDGDHEYVTLHHEIQQKNYQGGANAAESPSDKRMYASTSGSLCPVTMLKLFLQKTPPDAEHLFNQFRRQAQEDPQGHSIWFSSKPLSKRSFGEFLPDIRKAAGTSKRYTSHSLRATAMQCLNDAGMEARHIMYMSGHRNESSIRSYNRNVSSGQKRALSSTLSTLTSATETMQDLHDLRPSGTTNNSMAIVSRPQNSTASLDRIEVNETNSAPSVSTVASIVSNTMNVSSGFPSYFSNSTFSGCTFNFSK